MAVDPMDPKTWPPEIFQAGAKALGGWIDIEGDLLRAGAPSREHHLACVARDVFIAMAKASGCAPGVSANP
jgi:hypothetical protein